MPRALTARAPETHACIATGGNVSTFIEHVRRNYRIISRSLHYRTLLLSARVVLRELAVGKIVLTMAALAATNVDATQLF